MPGKANIRFDVRKESCFRRHKKTEQKQRNIKNVDEHTENRKTQEALLKERIAAL